MRNNFKKLTRFLPASKRGGAAIALTAACITLASADESRAHGIFIYAWAEGANLCAESYFSENDKVRGGAVTMRDAAGAVLAESPTDEAGRVCFSAPEKATALRFVVDAGQGHRAEYTMPEAEVAAAVAAVPAKATATESAENGGAAQPAAPSAAPSPSLNEDRLRELIREELQIQLTPLRQTLAQATAPKQPGLREIIGGLGWIAGLAALAHFAMSRRKNGKNGGDAP